MRHVGWVEEHGLANMGGFVHWHVKCHGCGSRYRIQARTATTLVCHNCNTPTEVSEVGCVYCEEATQSSAVAERAPSPPAQSKPAVGLFGRLVGAAVEANESAHGKRLRDGLVSTGDHLKRLDARVQEAALRGFLEKCQAISEDEVNWSRDGRIKMGRALQEEAKKQFDFNQAESFALWMAGAWLESGSRNSDDAVFVRHALEHLRQTLVE